MRGCIPTTTIGDRTAADHGDAHGDGFGILGHRRIKVFMSFSAAVSLIVAGDNGLNQATAGAYWLTGGKTRKVRMDGGSNRSHGTRGQEDSILSCRTGDGS
jgi:hypothetical protein